MSEREPPSTGDGPPTPGREESPSDPDIDRLLEELEELETLVDHPAEREQVRRAIRTVHHVPGLHAVENGIKRYTTRDMAEAFVGSVLLSLPLLVEDGVFEIGAHFVEFTVSGVPVFLLANVLFIGLLTTALLYWTDIRNVQVTEPVFGVVPRRLIGVLGISLFTATALMIMWGRIFEEDPTTLEAIGRIVVIWTAGAFGAALGDILPGESDGIDLTLERLEELRDDDR
jgi:uncharacterized membrane protein